LRRDEGRELVRLLASSRWRNAVFDWHGAHDVDRLVHRGDIAEIALVPHRKDLGMGAHPPSHNIQSNFMSKQ